MQVVQPLQYLTQNPPDLPLREKSLRTAILDDFLQQVAVLREFHYDTAFNLPQRVAGLIGERLFVADYIRVVD